MPHIFISYAKKDTYTLATRLRDELNAIPGVTTWMDERLEAGESWALQIQAEIDRADFVLVLLSPDVNRAATPTQARSFVLNEIDYAQQDGKRIIPVMAIRTKMPVQIAGIQYIDFSANTEAGIQRLVQDITRRAGIITPLTGVPSSKPDAKFDEIKVERKETNRTVWLAAIVVLIIVTGIGALIFSNLDRGLDENTLTPDPTTEVVAISTTQMSPTTEITATLTESVLTDTPFTPTATYTSSTTGTSTPTLAIFELASTPVARNADWTPVVRAFDGVVMVLVPVGCFDMGSEDGEADERPVEQQCIETPFWVDKYEVTNAQYKRCVDAGQCKLPGDTIYYNDSAYANHPVVNVDWFQASAYATWMGGRLPTEKEWEYAARGPDNLTYPWGNEFIAVNVVYDGNSDNQTAEIGSRPHGVSWVGALDLSGNVWEWTSNLYMPYPYDPAKTENSEDITRTRVLRGGYWGMSNNDFFRVATRFEVTPDGGSSARGFRLARSALP